MLGHKAKRIILTVIAALLGVAIAALFLETARGAGDPPVYFSGQILDGYGYPVRNSLEYVEFVLYSTAAATEATWVHPASVETGEEGEFVESLPLAFPDLPDKDRGWLTMKWSGQPATPQQIGAVPYALRSDAVQVDRQGGDADDWSAPGEENYLESAASVQSGSLRVYSIPPGWSNVMVATFPRPFAHTPIAVGTAAPQIVTSHGAGCYVTIDSVTTATVNLRAHNLYTSTQHIDVYWIAVGE
jgi:hypothetical protein